MTSSAGLHREFVGRNDIPSHGVIGPGPQAVHGHSDLNPRVSVLANPWQASVRAGRAPIDASGEVSRSLDRVNYPDRPKTRIIESTGIGATVS